MRPILTVLIAALSTPAAAAPSARAVVEAKFAAVNRHAIEDVVALYASEAVVTASDFCAPRRGRDEVRRIYQGIIGGVPDVVADVQEMIVEGDRVAVKFVVRSRIPGRSFDVPILDFFTVKDGQIVRDDGIFDNRGRACTP